MIATALVERSIVILTLIILDPLDKVAEFVLVLYVEGVVMISMTNVAFDFAHVGENFVCHESHLPVIAVYGIVSTISHFTISCLLEFIEEHSGDLSTYLNRSFAHCDYITNIIDVCESVSIEPTRVLIEYPLIVEEKSAHVLEQLLHVALRGKGFQLGQPLQHVILAFLDSL